MSEPESLATVEPLQNHLDRHALDRLVMLSDGIFAIATTLAALEIRVPEHAPTLAELMGGVGRTLAAYLLSFMIIAVFWISNRDLFARIRRVDRVITSLVLVMLCLIAIIPACAHAVYVQGNTMAAFRFYALVMATCGLLNMALWAYAGLRPNVMRDEVPRIFRWQRIAFAASMPVLFGTLAVLPDKNSLQVLIPLVLIIVVLRRLVVPRLVRRYEAAPG